LTSSSSRRAFHRREKAKAHIAAARARSSSPRRQERGPQRRDRVNEKSSTGKHKSSPSLVHHQLPARCQGLNDSFGIETGLMTTVHAFTNDQVFSTVPQDCAGRVPRHRRSSPPHGAQGVAWSCRAQGQVHACAARAGARRVAGRLTVNLSKGTTVEPSTRPCALPPTAAQGILVSDEPLVSADYLHDSRPPSSRAVDHGVGDKFFKVLACTTTSGLHCRVVDLCVHHEVL